MSNLSLSVIPVKTGIQCFQYVLDTRLRGYDELTEFINRLLLNANLESGGIQMERGMRNEGNGG